MVLRNDPSASFIIRRNCKLVLLQGKSRTELVTQRQVLSLVLSWPEDLVPARPLGGGGRGEERWKDWERGMEGVVMTLG